MSPEKKKGAFLHWKPDVAPTVQEDKMDLTRQMTHRFGRTSPFLLLLVAIAPPSVYYLYHRRRPSSDETSPEEDATLVTKVQEEVQHAGHLARQYFQRSIAWVKEQVGGSPNADCDDFLQRTRRPTDGEAEYKEKQRAEDDWFPAGPADSPEKKGAALPSPSPYRFQAEDMNKMSDDPLFTPQSPAPSLVRPTEYLFHPQLNGEEEEEAQQLPKEMRDAIHARSADQPQYEVSTEEGSYESVLEAVDEPKQEEVKKVEEQTASGRNSAIAFGQFVSN